MKIFLVLAVFLIACKGRTNGSDMVDLIRKQLGKEIVKIHTPNKYLYQSLSDRGIDVKGRTSLVFAVRACNDAHVALFATEPNMKDRNIYEIVIGGYKNRVSFIRNTRQGRPRVAHKARLLDCRQPRPFWISWGAGVIAVGTGQMVGENTFMTWTDPTPYKVNFAAVSSGWGSTADWEFDLSKPGIVKIHTPDKYLYQSLSDKGIDVRGRTSLVFDVRACNDAHVALFATEPNMKDRNIYEIVIGGYKNRVSFIRNTRQGRPRVAHKARLLDCRQPRPFWISWGAGVIAVGTGQMVGENTFMTWTDPTPYKVNFAAVSSGWGSTADWEFDLSKPVTGIVKIHTPNKYLYQSLSDKGIDVRGRTSLVFDVRACNDAHVALFATEPNMKDRNIYEIVIGGYKNRVSFIRNTRLGKPRAGHKARLLDCNRPKKFWISWRAGVIAVGTGQMVGKLTFMTWKDPTPYKVNFAAVSSGWGSTADWTFYP